MNSIVIVVSSITLPKTLLCLLGFFPEKLFNNSTNCFRVAVLQVASWLAGPRVVQN